MPVAGGRGADYRKEGVMPITVRTDAAHYREITRAIADRLGIEVPEAEILQWSRELEGKPVAIAVSALELLVAEYRMPAP